MFFWNMSSFKPTIPTKSFDALLGYRVFQTEICTNLFLEYKLLEPPDKVIRCSAGQ